MDNGKRSPFALDGEPLPDEPEPFAYEIRTYGHSPSGYQVTERVAISGELPAGFSRFVTTVLHTIQSGDKRYDKAAKDVPIPGNDIHEAIAALPAVVKQVSGMLHREMVAKLTGKELVKPGDPGFRL